MNCDYNNFPAYMYLKVAQMAFDIQFRKQCCSVKHDWMSFNYVSFESILIILHEIDMIIVIHPTTFFPLFQGSVFFLGHIVKAFQNNFAFIISIQKRVSGSNAYQIASWLYFPLQKLVSIPTIKSLFERRFETPRGGGGALTFGKGRGVWPQNLTPYP